MKIKKAFKILTPLIFLSSLQAVIVSSCNSNNKPSPDPTPSDVKTKKEFKKFVKFPTELYKGNKYYVPPMELDELNLTNPKDISVSGIEQISVKGDINENFKNTFFIYIFR